MYMRFIADDMLGSLARWLRMLGYDTIYTKHMHISDEEIAALARKERRILITRDRGLHKLVRSSILVRSTHVDEQLKEIIKLVRLKIPAEPTATLCPLCNGRLANVNKEGHKRDIPPKTYEAVNEFWKCMKCGQLYWPGKHWERITRLFKELSA